MERTYKFKEGQKVKMRDPDDGTMVYGEVTDTAVGVVMIQWEDLREPCEHPESEFDQIKLDTRKSS